MSEKEHIAVFDFCETLANFQTADAFVEFVLEHNGPTKWSRRCSFLRRCRAVKLLTMMFPDKSVNKSFVLLQLRGLPEQSIKKYGEQYYHEIVKPNLIQETVSELQYLKNNGYRVLLASGGYDVYLQRFADEYGIAREDVLSTNLKFRHGVFSGVFDGKDCMREEKVRRLEKILSKSNSIITAYSDSESDLPLLSWSDNPVGVMKKGRENNLSKYVLRTIHWK